jgi:hypothetical protein
MKPNLADTVGDEVALSTDTGNLTCASVRIEPATESDAPEIVAMIRGLAEYEDLLHLMAATEKDIREALFAWKPSAEVLLAFVGAECAGFALFFPTYCSVLAARGMFLDNLFVKPEWRGKGIGNALLRRLSKIASERNCRRLEWLCLKSNLSAIDFYQAQGAVPLPGWTKFRMTDEAIQRLCGGERL